MSARETAFLFTDPRRWTPPGYFVPGADPQFCAHCREHEVTHDGLERFCPRLPLEVRP